MSLVFIFTDFKDILFDFYSKPESYVQSPNCFGHTARTGLHFIRKLCTKQYWFDVCREGNIQFSYNSELEQEDCNIIVLVVVWLQEVLFIFVSSAGRVNIFSDTHPTLWRPFEVQSVYYVAGNLNKYFELENSWGCRPNSNYLLLMCLVKLHITHVRNTHLNCSVQTHQTCACSCVCTCTCPHTAYHI